MAIMELYWFILAETHTSQVVDIHSGKKLVPHVNS